MTGLLSVLELHSRVALDTSVFIYAIDANEKYFSLAECAIAWIRRAGHSGVTSTLSLTELLVPGFRELSTPEVDEYRTLLLTIPHLEWIAPDEDIATLAASYRAHYRLRTPDAIQIATAINREATLFITNDLHFRRVKDIDIALLDELL